MLHRCSTEREGNRKGVVVCGVGGVTGVSGMGGVRAAWHRAGVTTAQWRRALCAREMKEREMVGDR
jgi:hypothetical protein